jgi:hypothetical protein
VRGPGDWTGAWYASVADNARTTLLAAYEQIETGMTEEEVTALVGRPPDKGPVAEMTVRFKGWKSGDPKTLKKWSQYGTEMDVWFAEDGSVGGACISDPLGFWEQLEIWVGW